MFEFHVSRIAREKYSFDGSIFSFNGNVIFANFLAAREFAQKINQKRDLVRFPEMAVRAGDINAIGLIDEINHLVVSLYRKQIQPHIWHDAYDRLEKEFGKDSVAKVLNEFLFTFPPVDIYRHNLNTDEYLMASTAGLSHKHITLEELAMLWITNQNPAVNTFSELFDDRSLAQSTIYHSMIQSLKDFFTEKPHFGPNNQDLVTMLRSPAIEEPYSLSGQLEYIRLKWGSLIGDYLYRLLNSLDLIKEERRIAFTGPGPTQVLGFSELEDEENFSPDSDWMPRTVMIAKNTFVWLFQLSENHQREIKQLDQIPDEELQKLANAGINALWLIGLWERSEASKQIKQLCGNPEAVASAYSLKNYVISEALGGEEAYLHLRDRAWQYGIRLASDMVPNHMGIDSDWVVDHPDWFLNLPHSPFPSYSFTGIDLSPVERVSLQIEDHYYDRLDAAVVFKHKDRESGETRFIYHGNDGTSMPWNDTAQLNYLKEEVREAVIQTILHVAHKFQIIRFDAAMTLAKKHYQRLWFPQPGTGGGIPSRADQGLTRTAFDRLFPKEFWREVVDRVAVESPDTLLLAEAFWMMEGFFVRTLGMHRVYNSAFMNMLRNEENAKYRQLIKNTLVFDPQILKRYVNFMNNPDEKTAVEQFGKGDKYFGICTLMATMPGLPMFGHGQIEGFSEKYGMEYFRPYLDEKPDDYLIHRHEQEIYPLLRRRDMFSGIRHFQLFDFITTDNHVNEDVFAYSNGNGDQHVLVVYHNRFGSTSGRLQTSVSALDKTTGKLIEQPIAAALNLTNGSNHFVIFKDITSGLEFIRSSQEIISKGLFFQLKAYECHVFLDFRIVIDSDSGQYAHLNDYLSGRGIPSIDNALKDLVLSPVLNPFKRLIDISHLRAVYQSRLKITDQKLNVSMLAHHEERYLNFIRAIKDFLQLDNDISPIIQENRRGLEAILFLSIFEDQYPFPGSKKYKTLLKFIKKDLKEYPYIWYTLVLWNDLKLLGRVITPKSQYSEISRSWLDEWGLLRMVQQTLVELGFEVQQSYRCIDILKILVGYQDWIEKFVGSSPAALIGFWLSEEEIRKFIGINRYRDKLWFNKEAFESFAWWMMVSALIQLIGKPEKGMAEVVEILFDGYGLIEAILHAEAGSEYQVEKLLDKLK